MRVKVPASKKMRKSKSYTMKKKLQSHDKSVKPEVKEEEIIVSEEVLQKVSYNVPAQSQPLVI